MGICLDTEANIAAQEADDPRSDWKGGGHQNTSADPIRTPPDGNFPMQNIGKIKFDPPKVPVIFVLGGPGSGKVTHCDTLMQEKRGVTHINMMDLLQQYAIGNDMQDFSQLSSKTVTEVLMLEMKMAPAAKAYLVSGYPRSMRDVVEYSEKIQVVNGVILISWRQAVLQKQIDYGAKLGHVVLSLAKMELENFFKNVMPVADYFDQSDMLIAINGERSPNEVYKDFRGGILDILGAQDNQEALLNGVAGMGRGIDEIPGSIVSVETAPSQTKPTITENVNNKNDVRMTTATITNTASVGEGMMRPTSHNKIQQLNPNTLMGQNVVTGSLLSNNYQGQPPQQQQLRPSSNSIVDNLKVPPVIFVIGGPGSNKANLCLKIVNTNPSWSHFSIGRLLRTIAESQPKPNTENFMVKESIINGEMVNKKTVDRLIEAQLKLSLNKKGVIIDGYPRDMEQVKYFQNKYNQKSPIILLDCSKLQLGRGRLDDTVSSFRRRLELFRELTLPMLKQMDADGRLTIVDGDTDSTSVQRDFERIIRQHMQSFDNTNKDIINNDNLLLNDVVNNKLDNFPIVQDLDDDMPGRVPTISHHVSLSNGHLTNNHNINNNNNNNNSNNIQLINGGIKNLRNNKNNIQQQQNGHIANGRPSLKNMLEDAEKYSIDAHI